MRVSLRLLHVIALVSASLDWSHQEFSLLLSPGVKNCRDTCAGAELDCVNDIIDIDTLSEEFIKEWFYLMGYDCTTFNDNPRSVQDQPAINIAELLLRLETRNQNPELHPNERNECFRPHNMHVRQLERTRAETQPIVDIRKKFYYETKLYCPLAHSKCRNLGRSLPTIRSQQDQDAVHQVALAKFGPDLKIWLFYKSYYWRDVYPHATDPTKGAPFPYENWEEGAAPSDCAYMDTTTGKWHTSGCYQSYKALCQMQPFLWWGMCDNCWTPVAGQKLIGPIIAVHENTPDVSSCARFCQRSLQCLTANYKHAKKECELIPRLADNHPTDVIAEWGVEMLVRQLNNFVHW